MTKYFNDMFNVLTNVVDVRELPYPYAFTTRCLQSDVYAELKEKRPDWKKIAGNGSGTNNKRIDWSYQLGLDFCEPIWKDFIKYHTSHAFYRQILFKFGRYLKQFYPKIDFDGATIGLRGSGEKADLYLDCLIGINTPVTQKSSVSPPHLDHPNELWAGMLYMRADDDFAGGDFIVDKLTGIPREYGKRQIHKEEVLPYSIVPYQQNTFVGFVNSPISVHEVSEREVTNSPRLLVNFVLEKA